MWELIIIIALIWSAALMPFKMKGWLGGAVMGFAASKLLNPAGRLAKKGLGYGYDASMSSLEHKGIVTPRMLLKGIRERGAEKKAESQARLSSKAQDIRDIFTKGGVRGIRGSLGSSLEVARGNVQLEQETLTKDKQMRARQTKLKDLGRDEKIMYSFRTGDADGVRDLSDDELRDIEAADLSLAAAKDYNEKHKAVMAFHQDSIDMTLTPKERAEAKANRDRAVHAMRFENWDEYEKKIVKVEGGIMGRTAKANYFEQQYGEARGKHMYRLCSEASVEAGDDSWHGGVKIDPTTGELVWNRKADGVDPTTGETIWDWSKADTEAADTTAKREEQAAARMATYLAWGEMDDVKGAAIGGSLSSYGKTMAREQAGAINGILNQKRRNSRLEAMWASRDATTDKSTMHKMIEEQRAANGGTSMLADRITAEMKKDTLFDPTNSNHNLYLAAGLIQLDGTGKVDSFTF